MKASLLTAIIASLFISHSLSAQPRLKDKDVLGVWMLKININEEDIINEAADEDNPFARAIIKGVAGFVGGVISAIDVKFELLPDHRARVITEVMKQKDEEYARWWINDRGELEISDTKSFQSDNDTVWRLEDGVLVGYSNKKGNDMNRKVLLVRIQ